MTVNRDRLVNAMNEPQSWLLMNCDYGSQRYSKLSYDEVLNRKLGVMDATAIVLCRDNNIPLRIFNLFNSGDLVRIVRGESLGTSVERA